MLRQTRQSQPYERQEKKLDRTYFQRDFEFRQQGIVIKKKDDEIRQLKEKWQTDAKKLRNLKEEIGQKDQEVEKLKLLLDQHTLDFKSEQNPVSAISAKQVYIVNTFNDRNPDCIPILMY